MTAIWYLAELYAKAAKERDELRRANKMLFEALKPYLEGTGTTAETPQTESVSYQDTLLGQAGFEE